jgi:hypothetical protein
VSPDQEHSPQQSRSCPRLSKTSASDHFCSPCGLDGFSSEWRRHGGFYASLSDVFANWVPSDRWPSSWRCWGEVVCSGGGDLTAMELIARVSHDDVIQPTSPSFIYASRPTCKQHQTRRQLLNEAEIHKHDSTLLTKTFLRTQRRPGAGCGDRARAPRIAVSPGCKTPPEVRTRKSI